MLQVSICLKIEADSCASLLIEAFNPTELSELGLNNTLLVPTKENRLFNDCDIASTSLVEFGSLKSTASISKGEIQAPTKSGKFSTNLL